MATDLEKLSRTISHALRHDPDAYGITLDATGWTDVSRLLRAIARVRPKLAGAVEGDLQTIVSGSDKTRFEVAGGRIRARYGHSVDVEIVHPLAETVPAVLYHGTGEQTVAEILRDGIKAMSRQRVHLSSDVTLAHGRPAVLIVDTAAAAAAGSHFFLVDGEMFLADLIPAAAVALVCPWTA